MSESVRTIHIYTKANHEEAARLGAEMAEWLRGRGIDAVVLENALRGLEVPSIYDARRPQLILVIGGDGTFLSVARRTAAYRVPLLGINMGRLGFLTRMSVAGWREGLAEVLEEGLRVCERMTLTCEVLRNGAIIHTGRAINDVVVNRGVLARLVNMRLFYGETPITALRADGVIIASPTGSTAYNASAGGSLMHPDLECYGITAICSFPVALKPMLLPAERPVSVLVEEGAADVYLTEDGQRGVKLRGGDLVRVRRSEEGFLLVEVESCSWIRSLREKGFIPEV